MSFVYFMRQVFFFLLAYLTLPASLALLGLLDVDLGVCRFSIVPILYISAHLMEMAPANFQREIGPVVFAWAFSCFSIVVVWVVLTVVFSYLLQVEQDEVFTFLALCWIIIGVALFGWDRIAESSSDGHDVVVQRGRKRDDAPIYLYSPDDDQTDIIDTPHDIALGDDPEAYARYRAWTQPIPEEEFDDSYTYDVRRPYRLPFPKGSKYRALFEGKKK